VLHISFVGGLGALFGPNIQVNRTTARVLHVPQPRVHNLFPTASRITFIL